MKVVLIVVLVLVVVGGGYWFGFRGVDPRDAAKQAIEQTQQAGAALEKAAKGLGDKAKELVVAGSDIGGQLSGAVSGMTTAISGIKDSETAKAALPTLEKAKASLDQLNEKVGQMSAEGKKILATLVGTALPTIKTAAEKLAAIEGVGPVVKPTLDAMIKTLDGWSKA